MRHSALSSLSALSQSRGYWLGLCGLALTMLAVALYYQYVLGEEPCQVCIHVRLWVVGLALVALVCAVLPARQWSGLLGHVLIAGAALGLGERAWLLYELENGRGDSSCEFQLGMPDWFAVDQWFPSLFEVRNLCSYTPDMLFGTSMAEGLLLIALPTALISLALAFVIIKTPK
jgi:disulfide bond formation protein DsbB